MAEPTPIREIMSDDEQHDLLLALSEPFDGKVKRRKGAGGKMFDYVEGQDVIDFLNATVREWSFEILQVHDTELIDKDGVIVPMVRVVGRLTIPGLGSRCAMGVQVMKPGAGEDLEKGAGTDAIKTCARLFGVAGSLYRNDDQNRSEWTSNASSAVPMIRPEQKATIRDMIEGKLIDGAEVKAKYKVASASGLTAAQAREVIQAGETKRKLLAGDPPASAGPPEIEEPF